MAGAFPISTAKFESLGIKSTQNTIISKTISGKKLARQIDNQRFGFTARVITAKRDDVYGELMAFIVKQRSGKENFTIIPPEVSIARGNVSGTVLVNGVHAVGDTTITVDAISVVTYDNIAFTVHLTNDIQEFGAVGTAKDGALLYQFEFDVEESL
jgi:hypothetical protein